MTDNIMQMMEKNALKIDFFHEYISFKKDHNPHQPTLFIGCLRFDTLVVHKVYIHFSQRQMSKLHCKILKE